MAEPSWLKLGGLVEGICLNILTKKFFRSVNGRGKMAVKRQVPIATKVVKFVGGKPKLVHLWRTSRPTKKCFGAKTVLKTGVAKWPPKGVVEIEANAVVYCCDEHGHWV